MVHGFHKFCILTLCTGENGYVLGDFDKINSWRVTTWGAENLEAK